MNMLCFNSLRKSFEKMPSLTLLHSEKPKLYTILAFLSVIGLINMNKNRVHVLC